MPSEKETNYILYGIILVGICYAAITIFGSQIALSGSDHPPQVGIHRLDTEVYVTWMGGTDAGFVGNFTISINNSTPIVCEQPYLYGTIWEGYAPKNSSIKVMAWDKAVRTYRPIGNVDKI